MKTVRRYLQIGLIGVMAIGLMGLTATDTLVDQRAAVELESMFVSGEDYRAVVQERIGYAFSLGHYVGRYQASRTELTGWKDMVKALSGMGSPNSLAREVNGLRQEQMGFDVAVSLLADRKDSLNQELIGYDTVLQQTIDRNHALAQERLGLIIQLQQVAARTG